MRYMLDFPRVALLWWNIDVREAHMSTERPIHEEVHSSFILNSKTWKQPICSLAGDWLNKLVVPPYYGLSNNEKRGTVHGILDLRGIMLSLKTQFLDFPGGQESACHAGYTSSIPGSGRIPPAAERLSPRPQLLSLCSWSRRAAAPEPVCCKSGEAPALPQEEPTAGRPHDLHLERESHSWRQACTAAKVPSTAKRVE